MFQRKQIRCRRPAPIQARTTEAIRQHLVADSTKLNCTESEVIHIILSEHYGYDLLSGLKLPPPASKPRRKAARVSPSAETAS